ncbi:MAG: TPR domain protein, putative component of TonB system [Candidatus Ozemobacter sibiricus]|uniref:TPR domain protein, putative component of TonB system n=1 Tax=Candidatus Ozemobacter sibiricus TaxID=2268124 RepID=A0A367ZKM8_9BACT|nr:MAG: TPR domain protein, putative component of TonB system [Candidatus Ozemobacter sibiricus]
MPACPSCGLAYEKGIYCGRCGGRLPAPGQGGRGGRSKDGADRRAPDPPGGPPEAPAEPPPPTPPEAPAAPSPGRKDEGGARPAGAVDVAAEIERLNKLIKRQPSSPEAYCQLIDALLRAGKADKALSAFRAVKGLSPDHPRIYRLGARVYEALGRTEDAIAALDRVLKLDPHDLEAGLHSARLLREAGLRQQSLQRLQALRSRAAEHPEVLLRLAEVELSLGDAAAAQEDLSAYRRMAGETREMFLLLGRAMLAQNFFDGAVKHYQDGLRLFANDPDLRIGLGKAWLGLNERGKAVLEFERALLDRPDNVEILLEMGKLYADMGMEEKADEMFDRIRRQPIRDGEIFLRLARYFQSRAWNDRALAELEKAREISPHHPEIVQALGEVLEARGAFDRALAEYEEYLTGLPGTIWALQGVVRCAGRTGDFPRVAKAQKALIDAGQTHPDSWCDYGETLIRLGDFAGAEKAFEQAARLDPTCVRAYQAPELIRIEKARAEGEKLVQQAREAMTKRFFLTAIERLERALELVPRELSWLRLLAEVNLKIGDLPRASELLSRVRAAEPQDRWVAFQLARVYEFEEKEALAIELLSSLLKDHRTDIEANLALLRLKRSQIQGERFEQESLGAMIRALHADLAELRKRSPVPILLEGFANYIFGAGTRFQTETLKRAEQLFSEVVGQPEVSAWAHRGLALLYRVRGDYRQAVAHVQEWVKLGSDPQALIGLARLHENFQSYTEARKCYLSLKSLFPESGWFRRKIIEMMAKESEGGSRNELMDFLAECQNRSPQEKAQPWTLYEMAWAQTLVARRSPQRDEWAKRALLTWHKGVALPDAPSWLRWGLMQTQLEFLKGADRMRALQQNLKACEKIVRERPDQAWAHYHLGLCLLGFDDLAQTEQALKHLETAAFLQPAGADLLALLGRVYRQLGKPRRVDDVRYHLLLLEPEILHGL